MSLDILALGRLVQPATAGTSKNGKPYARARMSVATADGESTLLSLIAFKPDACTALLALGAGDSLAVAGRAKLSAWVDKTSGEPRAGADVVVEAVLTVYQIDKRRKAVQAAGAERHEHEPPAEPRHRAADRSARHAAPTDESDEAWLRGVSE